MSDTPFIHSDSSGEASSELHLQTAEQNGKTNMAREVVRTSNPLMKASWEAEGLELAHECALSMKSACYPRWPCWAVENLETLQVAKECIGERPRQQGCVTLTEMLENIKTSCAAGLAGNQAQYRILSHRTRTFLRGDKERYFSGLVEEVEGHFSANDLRPAYRALRKLRSKCISDKCYPENRCLLYVRHKGAVCELSWTLWTALHGGDTEHLPPNSWVACPQCWSTH